MIDADADADALLLAGGLQPLACKLSGNPLRAKTFQDTVPRLSSHLGAQELRSSIKPISTIGLTTVVRGNLIHFNPL